MVWMVGVSDCEYNIVVGLYETKELAVKALFKERNKLVEEWKKDNESMKKSIAEYCNKNNKKIWEDEMYTKMIKALSSDDYESWNNYPHEVPYIREYKISKES